MRISPKISVKPARHEEIERAERDAAEERVEEDVLAAQHFLEPFRPRREDEPEEHRDEDRDDQRPDRMASDELLHALYPRAGRRPPCG